MGRMRAQRKRTTRRNAKSRIVGEYTLSRILAPFHVSRKLAARFIIAEKIVEVEHIRTTMQDYFSERSSSVRARCNFSQNLHL